MKIPVSAVCVSVLFTDYVMVVGLLVKDKDLRVESSQKGLKT